jgi:hypothetical protein
VTDPQVSSKTSVPTVSPNAIKPEATEPRAFLSSARKASLGAAIILTIGLIGGLFIWGIDPDPSNFVAVAAADHPRIPIDRVSCLAIGPHDVVYDRKAYLDPGLPEAIGNALSIRTVLPGADCWACRWGFDFTVVPKVEHSVAYYGLPAQYLVSVAICERFLNGRMNPSKCVSKNIYVFTPRVAPHDLLLIALDGMAKKQKDEWELFRRKK